jgi:hypothetical protein
MILPLAELKPSPFNPKKPLTKKQREALRKNIDTFEFKRSLCVCRDFISGEGYLVLDGNTAIEILAEIGLEQADCHIVDKVTDEKSLQKFMAGYSINKDPIYSVFADVLGAEFTAFTGLDFSKYSFAEKIGGTEPVNSFLVEPQTQYFLTLPPDCVGRLKNFTKTKAFKLNKTGAILGKIDEMDEERFIESVIQIII